MYKPKFIEKMLVEHWQTVQDCCPPLHRFPEGPGWRSTPKLLKLRRYLNARSALKAMKDGVAEVKSFPTYLTIDPQSACNLRCPLCPTGNRSIDRKPGALQIDTFRHIVDEMGQYLYSIDLFNWGEPLLNKEIYQMIAYAKQKHILTSVSSNFHFFSEDAAEQMVKSGLDYIILSIDGATQETYQQYRVRGKLDRVVNNIKTLVAKKRELGSQTPYIFWQFLVFRHNEHEVEQARALAESLGVDQFQIEWAYMPVETREEVDRWVPLNPSYSRYDRQELEAKLARREAEQAAAASPTLPDRGEGAPLALLTARPGVAVAEAASAPPKPLRRRLADCRWLYTTMTVNADGNVAPCCAAQMKTDDIGTLNDGGTATALWNSKEYQSARLYSTRGVDNGVETVCHRCVLVPTEGEHG